MCICKFLFSPILPSPILLFFTLIESSPPLFSLLISLPRSGGRLVARRANHRVDTGSNLAPPFFIPCSSHFHASLSPNPGFITWLLLPEVCIKVFHVFSLIPPSLHLPKKMILESLAFILDECSSFSPPTPQHFSFCSLIRVPSFNNRRNRSLGPLVGFLF